MTKPGKGWIKLYRQLLTHELWLAEPFTRGQAWVDLLMLANHEEGFIRVRGIKIPIKRGQVGWSERRLAERWKWSRGKVRRFIFELISDQQIEQQKNNKTSTITILNYDEFQNYEPQNEPQTEPQTDHRQYPNKNDKNDKNEKKDKKIIYAEFVQLTETEYQKLISQFGEEATKKMIEVLDNYKGANGKKYKSDYRAILNWVVDRVTKQQKHPSIPKAFQSLDDWVGDDR